MRVLNLTGRAQSPVQPGSGGVHAAAREHLGVYFSYTDHPGRLFAPFGTVA